MFTVKKAVSLFITVVLAFALASVAFAHPGSTDPKGGHRDNSTGEYHYHHGYPAHQHEDMDSDGVLDCPYNFVDKTGQNSGSTTSGSYRSNTPAPSYTLRPAPAPTPTPTPAPSQVAKGGRLLGFSSFAGISLILFVKSRKVKKRKEQEEAECKRQEQMKWLAEKAEYTKQYGGKPLLVLAGAPSGCFVADDGFPATSGTERWGDGYTFYASYSGKAFHNRSCRFAHGCLPSNAYIYVRKYPRSDKYPCSYCRPSLPDLSWYEEYLRIKAIKDKYQID